MLPHELEIGYKLTTKKSIANHHNIQAEILDIKKVSENEEDKYLFYVHYINFNKRLDEWIEYDQFDMRMHVHVTKKRKWKDDKKNEVEKKDEEDKTYKLKNVQKIQIKNYLIDAWYFSPYPKRIAKSPIIFICPFCLFYFSEKEQLKLHNCGLKHPPGNEIYRQERKLVKHVKEKQESSCETEEDFANIPVSGKSQTSYPEMSDADLAQLGAKKVIKDYSKGNKIKAKGQKKPRITSPHDNVTIPCNPNNSDEVETISFFEIDGHIQKNYCRNLCLLSKLFLDHKTLYYDIDPFLFYILCVQKSDGFHIVGYFSKEKESVQGYNLACILTMPHCQRKGYGRILIDFSYLLSRKEGLAASPEKPLSDLGLLSYRKYWKEKIYACLTRNRNEISVREISTETGINEDDIVAVLSEEGAMKYYDGEACFVLKDWVEEKEGIDESCLKWETVKNDVAR